jgi:hypothetical protein
MAAGEDVERQVAVAVVEAREVPALLLAVHGIVRRVEIDDELAWRLVVGLHHQRHEQPLDRGRIVGDLVIGVCADLGRVLQAIERRLAGERGAIGALRRQCSGENAEHRIVAQPVVVDEVLVAERDAENALADQRWNSVDGGVGIAAIPEALRQTRHEADRLVGLTEKQRTGIRRDLTTIERAHDGAALDGSEIERILATLCRHRGEPPSRVKSLLHNNFR